MKTAGLGRAAASDRRAENGAGGKAAEQAEGKTTAAAMMTPLRRRFGRTSCDRSSDKHDGREHC